MAGAGAVPGWVGGTGGGGIGSTRWVGRVYLARCTCTWSGLPSLAYPVLPSLPSLPGPSDLVLTRAVWRVCVWLGGGGPGGLSGSQWYRDLVSS